MKKADFEQIPAIRDSRPYPEPHSDKLKGRSSWVLTRGFGLKQFGVNRVELAPGAWSSQRHWHKANDEVVVVVSGELTLVTDDGEELLGPGDCVGFKMGDPNPHHLQNRSDKPAVYFDIGGRDPWDISTFPDMGYEARPSMEIQFRPIKK
jgi:uncharacterized cupin superfamily protein